MRVLPDVTDADLRHSPALGVRVARGFWFGHVTACRAAPIMFVGSVSCSRCWWFTHRAMASDFIQLVSCPQYNCCHCNITTIIFDQSPSFSSAPRRLFGGFGGGPQIKFFLQYSKVRKCGLFENSILSTAHSSCTARSVALCTLFLTSFHFGRCGVQAVGIRAPLLEAVHATF